jgi:pre-mRNA cleavage complex 2 protein Pcf11
MSMYTQNGYGQVSYGGPSYTQTSGFYQPPPTLAPYYHVDPNTFRRDYASRLAELTVNSRPIIQSLSMIAQEYTRFSEIVAQCLEAHIRRVSTIFYPTVSTLQRWCCVIFERGSSYS